MSIKPLIIGNKHFPINLIQGPLAGYSNAPFRLLTWQYSQPAYSYTEMISSKSVHYLSPLTRHRYMKINDNEGPVCFQLSGNDPRLLSEAAKKIADEGATLIDLNCGCPVPKIRKKELGSRLLASASQLYHLITALKNNTSLPISVKIRVDGPHDSFNKEIANVIADAGADCLVVHGRHWTEGYETPCRYDEIAFFVDQLSIPVIGNGDVACLPSLKKIFKTGCAGVMIARSGVGQPWLIKKLISQWEGIKYVTPLAPEIGQIFLHHINGLVELFAGEKFAVLHARKLAKYYGRNLLRKKELIVQVNSCNRMSELEKIVNDFFVDEPITGN